MIVPRRVAIVALIVGPILVGGVVFLVADILPGLSLEAVAGLLPDWAITADVSHTVATLTAKTEPTEIGTIVATLDRFATSHGFNRDEDQAMRVQPLNLNPAHLDISYTGPRASLSFYTNPGQATLAIESKPGRNDDLKSLVEAINSTLGPLGFTVERQP